MPGSPRSRRDWNALSDAYRKRLVGAGVTREQYESGADLRKARGHGFKAPTPSGFPDESRKRVIDGASTVEDRRNMAAYRKSRSFPSWIPDDPAVLDDQVAAILSTIRPAPNATDARGRRAGWRDVQFMFNTDGTVTMTVTPIRGYPFDVQLPDRDAAAQVMSILRGLNTPGIDVDLGGEGYARPAKKAASRKAPAKKTPAKKAAKTPAKKAAKKGSAKKAAAKKAAKKAPAKKTPAARPAPAKKTPAARPAPAKKAAAKKTPAKKRPTLTRKAAPAKKRPSRRQQPTALDLLADTIGTAIDTAGEALDTAGEALGLE